MENDTFNTNPRPLPTVSYVVDISPEYEKREKTYAELLRRKTLECCCEGASKVSLPSYLETPPGFTDISWATARECRKTEETKKPFLERWEDFKEKLSDFVWDYLI